MIEKYSFLVPDFQKETPKELMLLSIISQSFFQPFLLEDNLLVILTALTSGSGIGFNRAMLFLIEGDRLKGEMWLGPGSPEEANSIWEVLSTPGIGYIEIIEHNRALLRRKDKDNLSNRIKDFSYSLHGEDSLIPALAASRREIIAVKDAAHEPLVDRSFLETIKANDFLCIPLLAQNEVLGEIVVDNAITNAPIEARDIKLASICGLIAGNYIYTASLHQKMVEMEKMAAMGEMAMFMTHQLRNPLTTMGGFTDQLLNSEMDEKKKRRNLQIIRDEIKRLEEVLFKLSRFLKVEIKEPASFEIQPVIASMLARSEIKSKFKSQGVNLKLRLEKNLPPLLCDPTYVGEIVRNLLDNALEATPRGGEVLVQIARENKKWLVLSVRDTGIGIPDQDKKKIFVPFFSTKEKGMGLGLVFAKRVMDACGGKIEVESREGEGSLFKLYFRTGEKE